MPEFDEDSLNKAKELFSEYKEKHILIDCDFEDSRWLITDEYAITGLNFRVEEFSYRRHYEKLFNMNVEEFTNSIKVFVTTLLGKYAPTSIRDFLNDIARLITINPEQIISGRADLSTFSITMCLNFLYMMPNERDYDLIESIENSIGYTNSGQRALAEFDTYFLFGEIMDDFWTSDMNEATRLFFYPLYLWWHITAIIPLRPREFIVTPRNCLKEKDGTHVLVIRRNMLKGRRKRGIKYKINEDYATQELNVSADMATEIQRYIDWTKKYDATDISTLLIADPHYAKFERRKTPLSRFYTMQNLYTCLRYFYSEVIEGIYHLKVVEKTAHIEAGEIGRLNLGDTRHLALINLMLEGGNPSLAMELAGHENIEMAAHYYSNVTNLVECRTYRQYRKVIGGNVQYSITPVAFGPLRDKGETLPDGNLCFSKAFASGEISDCLKAAGPNGEVAYCQKCSYYRSRGESYYVADEKYKEQIERDCKALADAVELVRLGKGYKEDIGEAMTKLKASTLTYSDYLAEKASHGGE